MCIHIYILKRPCWETPCLFCQTPNSVNSKRRSQKEKKENNPFQNGISVHPLQLRGKPTETSTLSHKTQMFSKKNTVLTTLPSPKVHQNSWAKYLLKSLEGLGGLTSSHDLCDDSFLLAIFFSFLLRTSAQHLKIRRRCVPITRSDVFQGSGGSISGRKQRSLTLFLLEGIGSRMLVWLVKIDAENLNGIYIYIHSSKKKKKKLEWISINSIHASSSCLWILALRFGRILRQTSCFPTFLFDVTAHHVTKKICFEKLNCLHLLAVHLGFANLLTSWFEFQARIRYDCFRMLRSWKPPSPPKKKTMRPGGYKPGKMTAVLKRKVSEFCQKKSLIASGKNKALTWLDVGFLCCCFLSNEPLELPQTKVLDVLLADSQSKISHIASKRLWLWWSAGFFWGNFRGFLSQTLGTLNLEPQET